MEGERRWAEGRGGRGRDGIATRTLWCHESDWEEEVWKLGWKIGRSGDSRSVIKEADEQS